MIAWKRVSMYVLLNTRMAVSERNFLFCTLHAKILCQKLSRPWVMNTGNLAWKRTSGQTNPKTRDYARRSNSISSQHITDSSVTRCNIDMGYFGHGDLIPLYRSFCTDIPSPWNLDTALPSPNRQTQIKILQLTRTTVLMTRVYTVQKNNPKPCRTEESIHPTNPTCLGQRTKPLTAHPWARQQSRRAPSRR